MALYQDLNDYEVLYMVKEKDEVAQNMLMEKYQPIIWKLARKYQKHAKANGLELEDLYQEGYLGLLNAAEQYKEDGGAVFYTYALISIQSKMINCIKRATASKHTILNQGISLYRNVNNDTNVELIELIEDFKAEKPEQNLLEQEMENLVKEFIHLLQFPESLVFELSYNGFKQNDISILLDMTPKLVKSYLQKSRKKLSMYVSKHWKKII